MWVREYVNNRFVRRYAAYSNLFSFFVFILEFRSEQKNERELTEQRNKMYRLQFMGLAVLDPEFSRPMLPWVVSEGTGFSNFGKITKETLLIRSMAIV